MAIKRAGTPRSTSIIHDGAQCEVCDWEVEETRNAVGLAAQHSKRTGHSVLAHQHVQVHYSSEYGRNQP